MGLIMCSIAGFGQTGSRVNLPGNDMTAQALSGLLHLTGTEEGTPIYPGMYLADGGGGVNGVAAVLAGLYYRSVQGLVKTSISHSMNVFHLHDVFLQNLFTYGDYNPGPTGRHRPGCYSLRLVSNAWRLDRLECTQSSVRALHS
jgi:crotonobetainyl-CoA:carnitine CoA-transferase CaiB-like acyl-CoA transferase